MSEDKQAQRFREWLAAEDEADGRKSQLMKRVADIAEELRRAREIGNAEAVERLLKELRGTSDEMDLL